MKRVLIFVALAAVFSIGIYPINSSCAQDEEVVETQVFISYEKIHPGMDLKIALRVDILGGWHINSNVPSEEYFEATNMEIPPESSFSFSEIKYPEAISLFLEFSESPVSVFEGEIFIGGIIPIPEVVSPGEYTIPLRFTYQACDDRSCLAPDMQEIEILIKVVDKKTPIQEINAEVFSKLGV